MQRIVFGMNDTEVKNLHLTGIQFAGTLEKLKKFLILKIEKVHRAWIILINGRWKNA